MPFPLRVILSLPNLQRRRGSWIRSLKTFPVHGVGAIADIGHAVFLMTNPRVAVGMLEVTAGEQIVVDGLYP